MSLWSKVKNAWKKFRGQEERVPFSIFSIRSDQPSLAHHVPLFHLLDYAGKLSFVQYEYVNGDSFQLLEPKIVAHAVDATGNVTLDFRVVPEDKNAIESTQPAYQPSASCAYVIGQTSRAGFDATRKVKEGHDAFVASALPYEFEQKLEQVVDGIFATKESGKKIVFENIVAPGERKAYILRSRYSPLQAKIDYATEAVASLLKKCSDGTWSTAFDTKTLMLDYNTASDVHLHASGERAHAKARDLVSSLLHEDDRRAYVEELMDGMDDLLERIEEHTGDAEYRALINILSDSLLTVEEKTEKILAVDALKQMQERNEIQNADIIIADEEGLAHRATYASHAHSGDAFGQPLSDTDKPLAKAGRRIVNNWDEFVHVYEKKLEVIELFDPSVYTRLMTHLDTALIHVDGATPIEEQERSAVELHRNGFKATMETLKNCEYHRDEQNAENYGEAVTRLLRTPGNVQSKLDELEVYADDAFQLYWRNFHHSDDAVPYSPELQPLLGKADSRVTLKTKVNAMAETIVRNHYAADGTLNYNFRDTHEDAAYHAIDIVRGLVKMIQYVDQVKEPEQFQRPVEKRKGLMERIVSYFRR